MKQKCIQPWKVWQISRTQIAKSTISLKITSKNCRYRFNNACLFSHAMCFSFLFSLYVFLRLWVFSDSSSQMDERTERIATSPRDGIQSLGDHCTWGPCNIPKHTKLYVRACNSFLFISSPPQSALREALLHATFEFIRF